MDKKQLTKDLQKIVDISKDGVQGYETAAERIEDSSMKTMFLRLSQQRKGFIEDVKTEAIRLGTELDDSGTVKGFFHRTWLTTKATFSSDTKENVINEAMTGEKKALEVYADVTADPELPEFLTDTLNEQERLIKVAIQQLQGLLKE